MATVFVFSSTDNRALDEVIRRFAIHFPAESTITVGESTSGISHRKVEFSQALEANTMTDIAHFDIPDTVSVFIRN